MTNKTGKRLFIQFIFLPLLFIMFDQHLSAQCNNGIQFGGATAPTGPNVVTITTCAFAGEYSVINSALAGTTYQFNATGGSGNFITIRQGTSGGTVLGFGTPPLNVICTANGQLFLHLNLNAACATDSECHIETITNLTPAIPSNNACANATPITCGGNAAGSTVSATIDGPPADCGGGSVAPDLWYTVTGTGTAMTASLCGSSYDTQIDVYTGACGALTNIGGCNDDFCGIQSQMTWASTLGVIYRIRVHGFNGSTGSFSLALSCIPAGSFQNMETMVIFSSLQEAIDAATPGQTIVLLDNVSESDVTVSNSVIINANGFTLTIPSGNLTIPTGNSLTWLSNNLIIAAGANIVNNGSLGNRGTINYNNLIPWTNNGEYKGTGTFNGAFTNNNTVSIGN